MGSLGPLSHSALFPGLWGTACGSPGPCPKAIGVCPQAFRALSLLIRVVGAVSPYHWGAVPGSLGLCPCSGSCPWSTAPCPLGIEGTSMLPLDIGVLSPIRALSPLLWGFSPDLQDPIPGPSLHLWGTIPAQSLVPGHQGHVPSSLGLSLGTGVLSLGIPVPPPALWGAVPTSLRCSPQSRLCPPFFGALPPTIPRPRGSIPAPLGAPSLP